MNYNNLAEEYDAKYKSVQSQRENKAIYEILKDLVNPENDRVLDLGCGTGLAVDLIDIKKYIGLDKSKNMIEIFKGKHADKTVIQCNAKDFKCYEPFDVILSLFSIPYIELNSIETIKENIREGGVFLAVYYKKPWKSVDSVYHGHKVKYLLSVAPKVRRYINRLKRSCKSYSIKPLISGDKSYEVITCWF